MEIARRTAWRSKFGAKTRPVPAARPVGFDTDGSWADRPVAVPAVVTGLPIAGLVGVNRPLIQHKLAVGAAHDPLEQEADLVARNIVETLRGGSGQGRTPQHLPAWAVGGTRDARAGVVRLLRHQLGRPDGRDANTQIGPEGGPLDAVREQAIRQARGRGRPLDASTRAEIEPLLGADLSSVRLHSGPEATALNDAMQARAFTVGPDVFFRGPVPDMHDAAGLELVAHELAHTVQQGVRVGGVGRVVVARKPGTAKKSAKPAASSGGSPVADPVGRALDAFVKCDDRKLMAAASAHAKVSKSGEKELGSHHAASGKVEAAAQAAAYSGAELRELTDGYAVLVEAGVVAGASLLLEGELKQKYGKYEGKLKGSLTAFAGVTAKASGVAGITRTGAFAQGSVKALAGAESTQSASAEIKVGDFGVGVDAQAREMAGAEFDADGTIAIGLKEIAIGGSFSAFAGAKVEGKVKASGKIYGREAVAAELTGVVSAGAGVSASGEFSFRRGVLRIKLAGDAAKGLGGGGGTTLVTDMKPIAVWVIRRAYRSYWNSHKDEAKAVLTNPKSVQAGLVDDLREYGAAKREQLGIGKADSYVKEEKIQQYVNKYVPRAMVRGHRNAAAIDAMIKDAVETAFTVGGKKTVEVDVKNAKVKIVKSVPAREYAKAKNIVKSEKTDKALSTVTTSSKG